MIMAGFPRRPLAPIEGRQGVLPDVDAKHAAWIMVLNPEDDRTAAKRGRDFPQGRAGAVFSLGGRHRPPLNTRSKQ
jgi:hypothetical protein